MLYPDANVNSIFRDLTLHTKRKNNRIEYIVMLYPATPMPPLRCADTQISPLIREHDSTVETFCPRNVVGELRLLLLLLVVELLLLDYGSTHRRLY